MIWTASSAWTRQNGPQLSPTSSVTVKSGPLAPHSAHVGTIDSVLGIRPGRSVPRFRFTSSGNGGLPDLI
jgi:hypothetical protein